MRGRGTGNGRSQKQDQQRRCFGRLLENLEGRVLFSTFIVDSTANSGAGSLRQAIIDANAAAGADTISFDIATVPATIKPTSTLPGITGDLTIDGTTQSGPSGKLIEIDGESAGTGVNGLNIKSGTVVIKGLVINRFNGAGIVLGGGSATIQNNYIGTDISGTKDEGCGSSGIIIAATSNNVIGGTSASTQGNIIAFNGTAGKFVPGIWLYGGGTGNQMLGNILFSNHGPGIDIVKKGKTPDGVNAMDPGDADTGTNNLQNQPGIGFAGLATGSPGSIHFLASLSSTPKHTYRIEFFGNPRDNTGSVQSEHFIGYTTVTTDKTGVVSIDVTFSGKFTDTFVTATATDLKSHDTSELCVAHPTYGGYVSGVVFNDANGDGVRQTTEAGLKGITVYCDANADGKFEAGETNTLTNSAGSYKLDLLYGGTQDIRADVPTGQRVTYPTTTANTVTLPTTKPGGKSFGLTTTVAISGLLFSDTNGDGTRETGEAGLSAWRIYIDKNNDGVWESGEKSVLTSSSGAFRFNGLSAGTYVIRVVQRTGYTLSTPSAGYYTVKLAAGATKSARNFGEKPTA